MAKKDEKKKAKPAPANDRAKRHPKSTGGSKKAHPEQKRAEREERKTRRDSKSPAAGDMAENAPNVPSEENRLDTEPLASELSEETTETKPFPIVGVGASAGGLEALEAFFQKVPNDCGIAFVVITHTDPKHASLLPSIIKRRTRTDVRQVEKGVPIEPDTIYLPPSDCDAVLVDEFFDLISRPGKESLHMPIDLFFRSLAQARGDRAGCVILSGTGTDGTHGLRAIKEHSGLAVVQRPETAKHQGMPNSAIETGLVDDVLDAAEMPERLIEYFRKAPEISSVEKRRGGKELDPLKQIFSFLSNKTRHDFSLYKTGTLSRRIARRITVTRSRNTSDYLKVLYRDTGEVRKLFQDLLIGVTNFFRDPEAFEFLKTRVLPELVFRKTDSQPIRVWVPGCATGEEAFSIAILLKECMEENSVAREVQIFGTDIDGQAIEKAREGEYLQNIAADVSEERLKRFFVKNGDRYRIKREIREPVIFAEQNILRDPPFSELDLLVCRNLLIYLQTVAQDKLLPLFHYTLKQDGILFLGNSETTGRFPKLFEPLSKAHSVYRKRESAVRPHIKFPTGRTDPVLFQVEPDIPAQDLPTEQPSIEQAVTDALLQKYTPPTVIINADGEILFTHGRTGRYLELASGKPILNIADMAREGLRFSLMAALRRVKESRKTIREEGIRLKTNGGYQRVDLILEPFEKPPLQDALMVVFRDLPNPETPSKKPEGHEPGENSAERIEKLEHELVRLRQDYRSAMEELETSNEELRSTNEEMQSSNEELMSTNEELESSREELQSLNEELNTVNSELQNKIDEVDESYRAITKALNSTRIAVIFLDNELRVTRFTREASRLVNLIDTDIRRPIEHISTNLQCDDLAEKARQVLDTLNAFEDEVRTEDGRWYRMSIMVHRKDDHVIEGVVLTFVNIDDQKRAQEEIEKCVK